MAVMQLPAESLEHIFCFLDGKSFSKVKEVCKSWSAIIKEMQSKRKIWKQFCLQEIPYYITAEILFFKTVPHDDAFLNWSLLYKKWYRSRMVMKAPYTFKSIQTSPKNQSSITCLKLSGSWIITGHSSGHLCIWNQQTGELWQRCLCHLKAIVDIALIDLINLGSYYGSDDLPWDHHHAITISKDTYIQVISLLERISTDKINHLNYHGADLTAIRVFDSTFAVSSSDNTVSVWGMKLNRKPFFHLHTTLLYRIIGPPDILLNLGLWFDQIQCISYSGKVRAYDRKRDEWSELACLKNTYVNATSHKLVTVTKSFIFRNQTAIMFTSDGRMVISVDDKFNNQYYLMRTLQTLIISVALRGTLLVLGGENGKIYVFYIPETKHLLKLNLSNPSFILRLSEASITSLDIVYSVESPIILAGTNESFYVVKWYSAVSSHQEIKKRSLIPNC
ncbi:uncharacterized protein [Parasteatoda tepidariorum]|uniref:uncharacterized protein isoform X1 n=1 Tax=Parasteatoda tepidariorum TaxID=114398 RepID=UPI00077FDD25|nr:uncharacterized protein LOC107446679 isoform X1 [Parasteatoda tepidariorum]XP_015916876.1 uncharacterized protein LOC107446679 isoform X1 [Parasteatoda tepidariorum]